MSRATRKLAAIVGITAVAGSVALAASVWYVSRHVEAVAQPHIHSDVRTIPARDVGLVLGTSRFSSSGLNEFYTARIEAAADLFHAGKISHVIVSGANPSRYYNEPVAMKRDLVKLGVPEHAITEDTHGLRTLDSVVRAHRVMGQEAFTIVSQRFHVARAVYLGKQFDLDVVAYSARDPEGRRDLASRAREYGARVKALLDVKVLGTQPKVLGEPILIDLRAEPETPPMDAMK